MQDLMVVTCPQLERQDDRSKHGALRQEWSSLFLLRSDSETLKAKIAVKQVVYSNVYDAIALGEPIANRSI